MRRGTRYLVWGAALLGLGLVVGRGGAATFALFGATTSNGTNNLSAAADWTAPSVSAAAIQKSQGGVAGYVKQAGTFHVFANVADSGNPASGVSTVAANVGNVATVSTATL